MDRGHRVPIFLTNDFIYLFFLSNRRNSCRRQGFSFLRRFFNFFRRPYTTHIVPVENILLSKGQGSISVLGVHVCALIMQGDIFRKQSNADPGSPNPPRRYNKQRKINFTKILSTTIYS